MQVPVNPKAVFPFPILSAGRVLRPGRKRRRKYEPDVSISTAAAERFLETFKGMSAASRPIVSALKRVKPDAPPLAPRKPK
jgi:hypothetical protein